ncbi:hypothetical protein KVR01_004740 [Diaporthe batatas]|uniref:uncharacterized protein n=1 Tax=Diaporthe batatas TaxID=748121 RepID=UPI001D04CC18|nr:uncharacterized protein KVR01_004740 [Diaporthe batatas]KAG8166188.1 hypothetical protein KVR01_004740 [Diaporthe batatas]
MRFVAHTAGDPGLAPCSTGSHLVIGIGEALLERLVATWQKRDAPGNDAGDTDTLEARTRRYD